MGLLCIGVGAMGEEEMDKSVTFLLENQAAFVGFDMAGAEQEVLRFEPFFRRGRDAGISATCRASEDLKDGKPQNALDAVRRTGHSIDVYPFPTPYSHLHCVLCGYGVQLCVQLCTPYSHALPPSPSLPLHRRWAGQQPLALPT